MVDPKMKTAFILAVAVLLARCASLTETLNDNKNQRAFKVLPNARYPSGLREYSREVQKRIPLREWSKERTPSYHDLMNLEKLLERGSNKKLGNKRLRSS